MAAAKAYPEALYGISAQWLEGRNPFQYLRCKHRLMTRIGIYRIKTETSVPNQSFEGSTTRVLQINWCPRLVAFGCI